MNPGVKGGESGAGPQLSQSNESSEGWEVDALLPIKSYFGRKFLSKKVHIKKVPFREYDAVRAVVSCAAFMTV